MSVFTIAELGCNHGGSVDVAEQMIFESARCGVSFVKGQKRNVHECLTAEQYYRPYEGPHAFGPTYGQHREALELSVDQWVRLKTAAHCADVALAMSVFDRTSAHEMYDIGIRVLKVGSGNIHDLTLLETVAGLMSKGDGRMLVSIGMSTASEVAELIELLARHIDAERVVWMQTTSAYPCPEHMVNLRVLSWLSERVWTWGLSGHYTSGAGAIEAAAVALGARWIERHFTLDRASKGTDHAASLEPPGLERVVKAVGSVERALGVAEKTVLPCEEAVRAKCRPNT